VFTVSCGEAGRGQAQVAATKSATALLDLLHWGNDIEGER
jgi:hypothetical protein